MSTGIEIVVAKAVTPLLIELAKGASGVVKTALKKWTDTNYTTKLASKLAVTDRIKTLWCPDKETSLLNIYFPSAVESASEHRRVVGSLKEFPSGNIVIEGIVGHGKSIFLRYLCLQELAGKGTGTLPLFLELRTLTKFKGLQEKLLEAMDKLDIDNSTEVFDYLAKSGKLTVLLDGFDELEESLTLDTINYLEFLMEKYPSLRIVVTSRPSNEIQKSRHMRVVRLCGLLKRDFPGFLQKLGLTAEKNFDIINAINGSPENISSVITTPLMLTLLVLVYESEREIPTELSEFFERLFSTMFTRHDRLKAGFSRKHYSGLSESRLQKMFEAFCFLCLKNRNGRTLNHSQFSNNFEKAKSVTKETDCSEANFKMDIVKVSCLMLEEGFDSINFLHKSIPEFFAASFIKNLTEEAAKKFYSKAVTQDEVWGASLSFLQKIDSYRYEKYYNLVRVHEILAILGSAENQISPMEAWMVLLESSSPEFGIALGKKHGGGIDDLDVHSWGPYSTSVPWGRQLQTRLTAHLMNGLQKDLPSTFSREIAKSEPNYFVPDESDGGEFHVNIKKLFSNMDLLETFRELQILEQHLWNEVSRGNKITKDEDEKISLIDEDII